MACTIRGPKSRAGLMAYPVVPPSESLRRAIVIVNETLRELRVEQHPDKTFVGWIKRGFTFLGYWITEKGVTGVAPSAWQGFQERVARLYEQNAPLVPTCINSS